MDGFIYFIIGDYDKQIKAMQRVSKIIKLKNLSKNDVHDLYLNYGIIMSDQCQFNFADLLQNPITRFLGISNSIEAKILKCECVLQWIDFHRNNTLIKKDKQDGIEDIRYRRIEKLFMIKENEANTNINDDSNIGYNINQATINAWKNISLRKECYWCLKKDVKLRKCKYCKHAHCCSRVCQKLDWKNGHHKRICSIK